MYYEMCLATPLFVTYVPFSPISWLESSKLGTYQPRSSCSSVDLEAHCAPLSPGSFNNHCQRKAEHATLSKGVSAMQSLNSHSDTRMPGDHLTGCSYSRFQEISERLNIKVYGGRKNLVHPGNLWLILVGFFLYHVRIDFSTHTPRGMIDKHFIYKSQTPQDNIGGKRFW